MDQENLFFDGVNDALRHLVRVLGGPKKVGHGLRPGKSPDDAGRWLSNALDGDRRESLHPEDLIQLLQMGRAIGCHVVMEEIAREGGYARPMPTEPEDEAAQLMREFNESRKAMEQIAKRLERLNLPVRAGRA